MSLRNAMRYVMVAFYLAAGILHLRNPEAFLPIMPEFLPWPREIIVATGIAEILGALGLLTQRLRRAAGIGLALYALCVFPANIKHAFEAVEIPSLPSGWWYHGPRLLLQPVLIWWALFCTRIVDWPARKG